MKMRRRFNRDAKRALLTLQELKDSLREMRDAVPHDREPELDALIGLLTDQQDCVLDDSYMDERQACLQLVLVNKFAVGIWRELGVAT
jgi:hypothetical protein